MCTECVLDICVQPCVCVCVCVCVLSYLTVYSPIDCSPPGFSVHGIFQARILEYVAISYSRGSSRPRDWIHITCISCIGRRTLYHECHLGSHIYGFLGGTHGKASACQCRRCRWCGFNPWVGKNPESRKWQHIPVFLPGKSHGQRSLVDYSLWGCKQSDMTAHTHTHTHTHTVVHKYPVHIQYTFGKMCWIALVIIKILIKNLWENTTHSLKRLKYKWLRIPRFGEEAQ